MNGQILTASNSAIFSFASHFSDDQVFEPIALRTAKTPYSFGCSECNRVKETVCSPKSAHFSRPLSSIKANKIEKVVSLCEMAGIHTQR